MFIIKKITIYDAYNFSYSNIDSDCLKRRYNDDIFRNLKWYTFTLLDTENNIEKECKIDELLSIKPFGFIDYLDNYFVKVIDNKFWKFLDIIDIVKYDKINSCHKYMYNKSNTSAKFVNVNGSIIPTIYNKEYNTFIITNSLLTVLDENNLFVGLNHEGDEVDIVLTILDLLIKMLENFPEIDMNRDICIVDNKASFKGFVTKLTLNSNKSLKTFLIKCVVLRR